MTATTALTCQRVVTVAENLPAAPRILAELKELLSDANNGIDEVGVLLRRDVGLTARVIRIANGVVYNKGDPVGSLEEALGRVGFNEVYRLAGMAALAQLSSFQFRFYGASAARFRENSLLVAILMEELTSGTGEDARIAFTIGLMRSVGKIALDAAAQRDLKFARPTMIGDRPLLTWEAETFGPSNTEVAAAVLRSWKFPADVYVPIRDHYMNQLAMEPLPLAKYLNLASAAAETSNLALPGEKPYWEAVAAQLPASLGLEAETIESAVARANERFERMRAALH